MILTSGNASMGPCSVSKCFVKRKSNGLANPNICRKRLKRKHKIKNKETAEWSLGPCLTHTRILGREVKEDLTGRTKGNRDKPLGMDSSLKIPKLFQWLIGGVVFLAVWIALVLGYVDIELNDSTKDIILFMPVFVAFAFAFYSVAVIGYRVATFNDCLAAAEELQAQIVEAKRDLISKGYKFEEKIEPIKGE